MNKTNLFGSRKLHIALIHYSIYDKLINVNKKYIYNKINSLFKNFHDQSHLK